MSKLIFITNFFYTFNKINIFLDKRNIILIATTFILLNNYTAIKKFGYIALTKFYIFI